MESSSLILMTLLSFILSALPVFGLPSGAPSTACVSMYPQHPGPNGPASAQTSLVVPFQIQVSPAQDGSRGYKITVVRNPNYQNGTPNLLGFFLQVRDPSADAPLGEFVNLPTYAKIGDCGSRNSLTHYDNTLKPVDQGLEFYWNPTNVPASTKNVQVLGTFVQNMQTFWVKVPSQIFSINSEDVAPVAAAPSNLPNLPSTDVPLSGSNSNNNNADINNDRKPGFGNTAGTPIINPPPNSIKINTPNSVPQFSAGLAALFAGLLLTL